MNKLIKAESLISLLSALGLFSIMFLIYTQWQSAQNKQSAYLFQQQQALQIAENQIARQMAGIACESRVVQNQMTFEIEQCSKSKIRIRFPTGAITIGKAE